MILSHWPLYSFPLNFDFDATKTSSNLMLPSHLVHRYFNLICDVDTSLSDSTTMLLSNLQHENFSFITNIHASPGILTLLPAGTFSFDASLSPSQLLLPCCLQLWSCLLSFNFDASVSPIWLQCFSFILSLHASVSAPISMHFSLILQFHHFDCDVSV